MPPIRRYLRITKYSVLECRIYLDNPADGTRWLLNPRDPALPRIIQSVKPLVLPKLREERERAREKGKKTKSVKDVVVEDDFEISIYLTDTSANHFLLTKSKVFKETTSKAGQAPPTSIMTDGLSANTAASPMLIREESDEESMDLDAIPLADDANAPSTRSRRSGQQANTVDLDSDSSDGLEVMDQSRSPSRGTMFLDNGDDKKRLALNTSYEGFSIYGRILCLVVTRKGGKATNSTTNQEAHGQEMMKDWIMSTQAPKEIEID